MIAVSEGKPRISRRSWEVINMVGFVASTRDARTERPVVEGLEICNVSTGFLVRSNLPVVAPPGLQEIQNRGLFSKRVLARPPDWYPGFRSVLPTDGKRRVDRFVFSSKDRIFAVVTPVFGFTDPVVQSEHADHG